MPNIQCSLSRTIRFCIFNYTNLFLLKKKGSIWKYKIRWVRWAVHVSRGQQDPGENQFKVIYSLRKNVYLVTKRWYKVLMTEKFQCQWLHELQKMLSHPQFSSHPLGAMFYPCHHYVTSFKYRSWWTLSMCSCPLCYTSPLQERCSSFCLKRPGCWLYSTEVKLGTLHEPLIPCDWLSLFPWINQLTEFPCSQAEQCARK